MLRILIISISLLFLFNTNAPATENNNKPNTPRTYSIESEYNEIKNILRPLNLTRDEFNALKQRMGKFNDNIDIVTSWSMLTHIEVFKLSINNELSFNNYLSKLGLLANLSQDNKQLQMLLNNKYLEIKNWRNEIKSNWGSLEKAIETGLYSKWHKAIVTCSFIIVSLKDLSDISLWKECLDELYEWQKTRKALNWYGPIECNVLDYINKVYEQANIEQLQNAIKAIKETMLMAEDKEKLLTAFPNISTTILSLSERLKKVEAEEANTTDKKQPTMSAEYLYGQIDFMFDHKLDSKTLSELRQKIGNVKGNIDPLTFLDSVTHIEVYRLCIGNEWAFNKYYNWLNAIAISGKQDKRYSELLKKRYLELRKLGQEFKTQYLEARKLNGAEDKAVKNLYYKWGSAHTTRSWIINLFNKLDDLSVWDDCIEELYECQAVRAEIGFITVEYNVLPYFAKTYEQADKEQLQRAIKVINDTIIKDDNKLFEDKTYERKIVANLEGRLKELEGKINFQIENNTHNNAKAEKTEQGDLSSFSWLKLAIALGVLVLLLGVIFIISKRRA